MKKLYQRMQCCHLSNWTKIDQNRTNTGQQFNAKLDQYQEGVVYQARVTDNKGETENYIGVAKNSNKDILNTKVLWEKVNN